MPDVRGRASDGRPASSRLPAVEPDDGRAVTVRFTADQQIAKIGASWREVFPGLEAVLPGSVGSEITVVFRPTPPDGQARD